MTQGPSHDIGAEGTRMGDDEQLLTDDDFQTWEDVETTSPTPVADDLREFATMVANVERTVGDDGDVSVYFTDDKSRTTVTYDD